MDDPTLIGPDGFTRLAENIAHDAALVRMAQADGWDNAVQEAEDCGLLNDVFADEMRGRNPYRRDDHDENARGGHTYSGSWAADRHDTTEARDD